MINLKFGINFEFNRDKSKDKIYDETKIEWKPEVKDASIPNTDNKLDNTQPK